MKPQALTGPEIDEVWSDEIGYDASFSERTAIQRLIAARDAQWAAMIGEPVAWQTFDGEGGYEYRAYEGNEGYSADWQKRNPRHSGWVSPLYAIKETP